MSSTQVVTIGGDIYVYGMSFRSFSLATPNILQYLPFSFHRSHSYFGLRLSWESRHDFPCRVNSYLPFGFDHENSLESNTRFTSCEVMFTDVTRILMEGYAMMPRYFLCRQKNCWKGVSSCPITFNSLFRFQMK